MTIWHLTIAAALGGITILAVAGARAAYPRRWQTLVAGTLRILFGIAIIAAFFEPSLSVHRLPDRNRTLPILVDASQSMSFFNTDSVIEAFSRACAPFTDNQSLPHRKPVWMFFGDSLRTAATPSTYTAADKSSFFPQVRRYPLLQSCTDMIVLSDANWSNPTPVTGEPGAKAVWYLPLHRVRSSATISCDVPDTIVTPADTTFLLSMFCSGTAVSNAGVALIISNGATVVGTDSQTVSRGAFRQRFSVKLPRVPPGLHLYRVTAINRSDTVQCSRLLLRQAVAGSFSYTVAAPAPQLDIRFLRSALAGNSAFREAPAAKTASADLRFVFDGSPPPSPAPHTLSVYMGVLPGAAPAVDTIMPGRLIAGVSSRNPFYRTMVDGLPPVAATRPGKKISVTSAWVSAAATRDTIPLIFRGMCNNQPLIGCGFSGLWRWDFLPLAHSSGEADAFPFTRRLLDAAAATLRELQTDTLLVYPTRPPIAEAPAKFTVILPTANIPELQTVSLFITIRTDSSKVVFDTTLQIIATGRMFHEAVLPPLDSGSYTARSTLSTGLRTYSSAVAFTTENNTAELSVTAQNENLLRDLGQPLRMNDTTLLASLFNPQYRSLEQEPVVQKIRFKRSWWLLALLLGLLGTEWTLRRFARLD